MMTEIRDKAAQAVRETAAGWIVRLSAADVPLGDEEAFFEWLKRSPVHVEEYLRAEAAWLTLDDVAVKDSTRLESLLHELPLNVVELPQGEGMPVARVHGKNRRFGMTASRAMLVGIAATVVLAFGAGLRPGLLDGFAFHAYSTAVGEQRSIALADGSIVQLNTHSKIHIHFSERSRDIDLDHGEAFFKVARDARRPFRVTSDATVVRAVGTEFNVYRQAKQTVVTVIEGRVAVTGKHLAPLAEDAGEKVIIPAAAGSDAPRPKVAAVNPRNAVAWRERRLIFENETLAAVAAEFNRYNARQIVIEDPMLAGVRMSGVFDADKPDALAQFLEKLGDAQVEKIAGSRITLKRP